MITGTRARLAVLIVLASLFAVFTLVVSRPAQAGTDDYPDRGAVDCSSQFGAYSWCEDSNHDGVFQTAEQYSSRGYGYRNCTDFAAFRLRSRNGFALPGGIGNANNWDDWARSHGYTVNSTPAVGSVAQTDAGSYGHLAWVEAVGNGTVTVEEYNHNANGTYDERTVSVGTFVYIHFADIASPPPVVGPVSVAAGNNNGQMAVQLTNFPTGTAYFFCHTGDPSTYPAGGSVPNRGQLTVSSSSQSWSSGICSGSGNFWVGIQAPDGNSYYSNQVTLGTAPPSVSIGNSGGQMTVQLSNFPTGVSYFFCHFGDPSGFPSGGSVPNHGQITVTSSNQSWSSGLCSGSGNAWIGIQATDGNSYYSNQAVLGTAPYGSADTVESTTAAAVHVGGWAVDGDTPTAPVTIHVYIGDEGHVLGAAGGYRPDVGAAYPGVGDYHGYDGQITTAKTGTQNVCVYAIDTQGGPNPQLGCRTVNILTDTTPPQVVTFSPADQSHTNPVSTVLTVTFSEPVVGVDTHSFQIDESPGITVPTTAQYDAATRTATLTPTGPLDPDASYDVSLASGSGTITDLAGNSLAAKFWTFSTGPAPAITFASPADGAADVPVLGPIQVNLSELVGGVDSSSFHIRPCGASTALAATVSYDPNGSVAWLVPAARLLSNTRYCIVIGGGAITDGSGNPLPAAQWSFTTMTTTDTTAPRITAHSPAVKATAVATGANVSITFSEPVNLGGAPVTVVDAAGTPVNFGSSYIASTHQWTLDTAGLLQADTKYTVTVIGGGKYGVTDISGNPLAKTVWSFTTGSAPTVTGHTPTSGATGVGRTTRISATFSEAVQGVSGTTVLLRNAAGVTVVATVAYNAVTRVVTLTPTTALGARVTYTVTMTGSTSAIRDLVGNPLKTVKWSFSTGA